MNESSLEKRLRFQLACSVIVWRKAQPHRFASVTSESGRHRISLPPGYDDWYTLQTLIHELCHVAVPGELGAFGSFQEDIIERVLEPRLVDWLARHPKAQGWWLAKLRAARPKKRTK